MVPDIDTNEHTVDELIQLWQDDKLHPEDGEVHNIDNETMTLEVVFEGRDSDLFVEGTVDPCLSKLTFQMKQEAQPEVTVDAAG